MSMPIPEAMKNHPNFEIWYKANEELFKLGSPVHTLYLLVIFENGAVGHCAVHRGSTAIPLTEKQKDNLLRHMAKL